MRSLILPILLLIQLSIEGKEVKINTSNQGKLLEFQRLFAKYDVQISTTSVDLAEIDADPLMVVVHKASQLDEGVIVEDTSLEVEGAAVGVHVKWLLDNLEEHSGKKALWKVLLAYKSNGIVYVYAGEVAGRLVSGRGNSGFGFDRIFVPDSATQTLGESKPDSVNARALAVDALMQNRLYASMPQLEQWDGPFQNEPR
jgi:XTP/dITP diphosphohydrolase